jgi:hemoglobin
MKRERQPGDYGYEDTSFRAMGGEEGIRRLVDLFYDAMERRPDAQRIRSMHPSDLQISRDKLWTFLCGWLGGPKRYAERYGPIRLPHAHAHLDLDEAERDAWLACMQEAIDAMDVAEDFKAYFMREIRVPAERSMQMARAATQERAAKAAARRSEHADGQ